MLSFVTNQMFVIIAKFENQYIHPHCVETRQHSEE